MKKIQLLSALVVIFAVALGAAGCGGSNSSPYAQNTGGGSTSTSFSLTGGGSVTTNPGSAAVYNVSITNVQNPGLATTALLNATGLPAGATPTWSVNPLPIGSGSGTTQLTIATTAAVTPGTYHFTIAATIGSVTRTISGTLVVAAQTHVQVTGGGTSTTPQGGNATFPINAQIVAGAALAPRAANDVTLAVTGLPAGATGTFSVNPLTATTAGAHSTLTVTTTAGLAAGNYPFSIVATVNGTPQTLAATLTVTPVQQQTNFTVTGPSTATIVLSNQNPAALYNGTVALTSGQGPVVTLSVSGLPAAYTTFFTPTDTVTPTGTGTAFVLHIVPPQGAQAAVIPFTITGTAGALVRTLNATLTVTNNGS